jgi:hypothetical protein
LISLLKNLTRWANFFTTHHCKNKLFFVDSNTKIYVTAKSETSGQVDLTPLAATAIPHGEAVILKTSAADHKMTLTKTTGATTLGANVLTVTDGTNDVDGYRLGYKTGTGVAFFPYAATAPAAGIVYIAADNVNTGEGAPAFLNVGETTDVSEKVTVNSEQFATAPVYDLNGLRVSQPTKGLYIVNGKKVIVK